MDNDYILKALWYVKIRSDGCGDGYYLSVQEKGSGDVVLGMEMRPEVSGGNEEFVKATKLPFVVKSASV